MRSDSSFRFLVRPLIPVVCLIVSLLLASGPLAAQQSTPVLVTQAVDDAVRTTLSGNTHPFATPEFDRGEAPPDLPMKRMLLVLKRSDQQEATLRRLIENQQDKNSPYYHQWLTPQEFGATFGPGDSDIAAVVNWLKAGGFEIVQVSKGRTIIEFSGTAGLVKQAFGTAIHKFVRNGEEHWANASDPTIPTALAPVVVGVNSLHNFRKKAQSKFVGTYSEKSKRLSSPQPEFTFNGGCTQNGNCYAVVPYDFATIYSLLPLWNAPTPINGTGQTIAIVGRTDIDPTDATDFWSLFGLDGVHAPQPTLTITYNGPNPGFNGDESEADIDTQWSGAAAPGATINFVASESTETTDGVDLSALYIVDNNLAPVLSESYGQCERNLGVSGVTFYGLLWEQAAAQGISAFVSTGDNGAAGCDDPGFPALNGLNVNGLASTPFNAAVGGTDFNQFTNDPLTFWKQTNDPITQESARGYIPETTWNDSCTNGLFQFLQGGTTNPETNCNNPNFAGFLDSIGGSGGKSLAWQKPEWQTGTPNDNSRDLPDISLFASNGFLGSFYVICQKHFTGFCDLNDFLGFGGTSVSSPAFAGIMALVNQKWGVQGNPNFVLYKLPAKQANAFHDVPSGTTIAMPCATNSSDCTTNVPGHAFGVLTGFSTGTAYDRATGLGSVDAANLVNNWNKVLFTPSTTTLTLNSGAPVHVAHGASVQVNIGVTPGSPAPTGDVALLLSPGTPGQPGIDAFTLANGVVTGATTTLLPGGVYKVIAHYEGDTTYGGSYSSSVDVSVTAENSSVFMPGLVIGTDVGHPVYSTSVSYGSPYLLRADVRTSQGKFCNPLALGNPLPFIACPTGTVTFTDNGGPLDAGTYKLNSLGYTEDQAIQLTGGSHSLVATYSGDNSYNASTQTQPIIITKATSAIGDVAAPVSAVPGQGFNLTASVFTVSSGVAPTGTVSFFANGALLPGTVQLMPVNGSSSNNASLGATLITSISTPGSYSISATYSGDGNYANVSQSNTVTMAIFDFAIPATLAAPASPEPGQSTTTSMTISPVGGGPFTNTVTYHCISPPLGVSCSFSPTQIDARAGAGSVQITVSTAGPFTGTATSGARHKFIGQNQRPWLPLSLPLAAMVLVGLAGRGLPLRQKLVGLCLALAFMGFLVACGGGGSSTPPPPPPISVSVSPGSVNTLYPNLTGAPAQTQQFTATVHNSTNQAVNWQVNGVAGGNATFGTIDASGNYTAPATVPNPATFNVTAFAQADISKSGNASVTIQMPTPAGQYRIIVLVDEGNVEHQTTFNLTVQ
jgi:Pro-kumamolisin, activation domain/Bacterial Ig-like domain (group 3)